MKTRIIFGAILIAGIAGLLVLDWWLGTDAAPPRLAGLPLALLFVLLAVLSLIEIARMGARTGASILPLSAFAGVVAAATLPYWWRLAFGAVPSGDQYAMVLGLTAAVVFVEQMIRSRIDQVFARLGITALALLYLGVGSSLILAIRLQYGVQVLVLFVVAVKLTDIGAYFTGSFLGRHKLIPWLSPGKSWEGLAGGLLAAAVASVAAVWIMRIDMGLWQAAVFGAVVGAAGQFADLCESLLKRSAGVKDSGAIVPSFGGVLDIIDSPLLSAPVAYLLLTVLAA